MSHVRINYRTRSRDFVFCVCHPVTIRVTFYSSSPFFLGNAVLRSNRRPDFKREANFNRTEFTSEPVFM